MTLRRNHVGFQLFDNLSSDTFPLPAGITRLIEIREGPAFLQVLQHAIEHFAVGMYQIIFTTRCMYDTNIYEMRIGQDDDCVVLPIQFVHRIQETDDAGQATEEELELYAAVLVVGPRSGHKGGRYQASILFKLIEADSSTAVEISERFVHIVFL